VLLGSGRSHKKTSVHTFEDSSANNQTTNIQSKYMDNNKKHQQETQTSQTTKYDDTILFEQLKTLLSHNGQQEYLCVLFLVYT
jgi:hypothetical protein